VSEWEVWNVKVNVMEGYEGAVRKVVKYPSQSKSGENAKDPKMKVGHIVKSISENNKAATDVMDKSSYLQLLAIQEDNMKRLVEVLNGKEDDEKDKDREAEERCWTRERGLAEISIKREEREKLELILVVDRELGDF
jgi:hypothetical protein